MMIKMVMMMTVIDDDALKYTCISRKLAIKSKGIYEFHYKG